MTHGSLFSGIGGGDLAAEWMGWEEWQDFPTKPPIYSRNDGISRRMVGITISEWRKQSVEALGNAVVPQVAFQIFKAIDQYQKNNTA